AGKSGVKYTIVVGGSELESGQIKIKNMETGEQLDCSLNPEAIAQIVKA
ncbi:MAG: hypothetical protein GX942_01520, partial [Papillibacter sp.]|nr:hypothetical protein [Papillibacter sp.]